MSKVLISICIGVANGAAFEPVQFHTMTGSRYSNLADFYVNVETSLEFTRSVPGPVRFLFSTGETQSWLEKGGFAIVSTTRRFQPKPDRVEPQVDVNIDGKLEIQTPLTIRHQYPTTFRRAAGLIAASPRSVFAQTHGPFTIRRTAEGGPFQLSLEPLHSQDPWIHVPMMNPDNWDIPVQFEIDGLEPRPLVGRLNTGFRGLIIPQSLYTRLTEIIESHGHKVLHNSAAGGFGIHQCQRELLPSIRIGLTPDVIVTLPLVRPGNGEFCIADIVPGEDEGLIHLGELFLGEFATNFDRAANLISFL